MTRRVGARGALRVLAGWTACLALASPAGAQVTTEIVTDGTLPGSTRVELGPTLAGLFVIDEGLGFRPGGPTARTLLHSFWAFSVGGGDTARFTADHPTDNVISRITGRDPSRIYGTIESGIAGADFYFLNPNGIFFGPNAQLDLTGSFHASTAESVSFASGEVFEARIGGRIPALAVAAPFTFGFLGGIESKITVDGSVLGNLGGITLRGGAVELSNGAVVQANTFGSGPAGDIVIEASQSITLSGTSGSDGRGSTLQSATGGSGAAGSIRLMAPVIRLEDGAQLSAQSFFAVGGPGADIVIDASESLTLSGIDESGFGSVIKTSSVGGSHAEPGSIVIRTSRLELRDHAKVLAETTSGARGGDISVNADTVTLRGGSLLTTNTTAAGAAGNIRVIASQRIELIGTDPCFGGVCFGSSFQAATGSTGPGGSIVVETPILELTGGAAITVESLGTGDSGEITIDVGDRVLVSGTASNGVATAIKTDSRVSGDAGDIFITAPLLQIQDGAIVRASTSGTDAGGSITIDVAQLRMSASAKMVADSTGKFLLVGDDPGAAGSILIGPGDAKHPTRRVTLSDSEISTIAVEGPEVIPGEDPASTELRREGNITVNASKLVLLENGSTITASVVEGLGGSVQIGDPESAVPEGVVLRDASQILAQATGGDVPAQGGRIDITAGVFLKSLDSVVSADAGAGIAGSVNINAPTTNIVNGIAPLNVSFLDASALIRPRCVARGDQGSFTVARRRGLPPSPEDLLLAFDEIGGEAADIAASDDDLPPVASPGPKGASNQIAHVALSEGALAFRGGYFEAAEQHWAEAAEAAARGGDAAGQGDALRGRAQSQQARGAYADSLASLSDALALAEAAGDTARTAAALANLANTNLALGRPDAAEELLTRALRAARESEQTDVVARVLNDLGNQHAVRRAYLPALAAYGESAKLAREARDPLLEARAVSNATRAALAAGQTEVAVRLLERADLVARTLPASHATVFVRIHIAKSYERLIEIDPARRKESLLRAYKALMAAITMARDLRSDDTLAYALGNLGALYQREHRTEEALFLTRRALRVSERGDATESLYRWHWQEGQLLWARGEAEEAIRSYRRAVDLLDETRQETRAQYGSAEVYFRNRVAPAYFDLVDALLQAATRAGDSAAADRLLVEARDVVERFKAAELRDYFRDECVLELEAKATGIEQVSDQAAIVYPILLPDRLELLVSLPSGLVRYTVPVGAVEVAREARTFRRLLVKRNSREYRPHAELLYDWLVRPYVQALVAQKITTLVFVPGGPLRGIPMAALHDGSAFLAERYALAVTPTMHLIAPQPLDRADANVLLGGVSEAVQGFPPLAMVSAELEAVREIFGGEVLLDAAFEEERLEAAMAALDPSIVHLATHAVFTGDPATSFLLTYDGRLTLDRLGDIIGQGRFREKPLELLTLSACETAAGDDRAALGLAGVAIRAGARSALGSLWVVEDAATYALMVAFYEQLKVPEVSKALALNRAQQIVRGTPGLEHPFYWSPFLLIGNWL